MELVYVVSPYRGDTEANTELAKRVCAMALAEGKVPYASHLFFPQFLDDNDPEEREAGMKAGLEMMQLATEVWVVGNRITDGMAKEIGRANELGIPIFTVEDPEVGCERLMEDMYDTGRTDRDCCRGNGCKHVHCVLRS